MYKFLLVLLSTITYSYANLSYVGVYNLDVQIGDSQFVDIFEIKSIKETIVLGSFTAPGAFVANFEGIRLKNIVRGSFMAKENGHEYIVFLEARFGDSKCTLEGELFTDNSKFATFSGKKRDCNE